VELKTQETPDGVKIITLAGRMDIAGTQEIDLRFTNLAASQKSLVAVDISGVTFLASIGMRTLVSSARALMNRGGAMALANPQPLVQQALIAAGIDSLIPIYPDAQQATQGLLASARS
jgi:anti-anti-sigma factor